MRTLYVMDPLDRLHFEGDSTCALMLEHTRRGQPTAMCTPGDLFARQGEAWARITPIEVTEDAPHFHTGASVDRRLGDFDVVWMRKDPPFDMDYVFTTYLLDLVPDDTLVLNDPRSIRVANEKMFALWWPELCPRTLVTREIARARAFIDAAPGKVVLKPWDGNGGRGVLVTHAADANLRSMLELLTEAERTYVIVQHYLPEILQGDKRVILFDGEPVGWMLRVPQAGDHRGNMHVGATVEACELTPRDREICAAIGPSLREMGLLFVGIDIIGDYMTEINVTSPTGFREIRDLMGVDLASELVDRVAERLARHQEDA